MTNPDHNPYAPPIAGGPTPETPAAPLPDQTNLAQRLAGAFMIVNALLVIPESLLIKSTPDPIAPMSGPTSFLPALIDFGIGISLIRGSRKTLVWALVRVCFGLAVGVGMRLFQADYVAAVLQLLLSAGLLLLLVGNAGVARITLGSVSFGAYALAGLIGLVSLATGRNPIAGTVSQLSGDTEPAPAKEVVGVAVAYSVTAPNDNWHLRKAEAARKDNQIVDRWLVRPDRDAHVLVIAEHAPGSELPIEAYTDAILEGARKSSTGFTLVERKPLRGYSENGRFLHTRSTVKGIDIEHYYGLVTVHDRAYQVVGFAPRADFPNLAPELLRVIESFRLPPP